MNAAAKEGRRANHAKAMRLAGPQNDPHKKVDASSWTPNEALQAGRKTGARPVRARIYKLGGAIQHDRAAIKGDHADRHPGKMARGGYAKGGAVEPSKLPKGYGSAYADKSTGWKFKYKDDDEKPSKPTPKAAGGKVGTGPLSMANVPAENKREFGSYHEGGYKRGGTPKAGQDMAAMKTMVHKHEHHDHRGEPLTKLRHGGQPEKWIKGAIKHPGSLHKALDVPQDKNIPAKKLEKATHSDNPKIAKKANLAKTLKSFHADGGAVGTYFGGTRPTGGRMPRADGGAIAAQKAFQVADDAWGDELRRSFGKNAGDVRYTARGKGEEGSTLRRLHDAREVARTAWENATRKPRARGGRTKGKTNIKIVINAKPDQPPQLPPQGVVRPPPPPMPPPQMPPPAAGGPPGGAPMMAGPPGMPPGGPMPRKRGGKVYRSAADMDAGAESGLGRLEKTEIQAHRR